jgi:hypothetical protein
VRNQTASGAQLQPQTDGKGEPDLQDHVVRAPVSARLLVLAGPGTGKTETVARRLVDFLRQGIRPAQVLVLSFSRSAVRTLTSRVERTVASSSDDLLELRHLSIRTFDAWSFRILRLLGHLPKDLLGRGYDQTIKLLVDELRSARREQVREVLGNVRHVIVDEFQDLSGVRGALVLELLGLLAPPGRTGVGFTVLGDEAQAIYGFALANGDDDAYSDLTAKKLLEDLRLRYSRELRVVEFKTNHRAVKNLAGLAEALRSILGRPIAGASKLDAMSKLVSRIPPFDDELSAASVFVPSEGSTGILTRTNGEAIRIAQKLWGTEEAPGDVPVNLTAGSPSRFVPAWIGATLGRFRGGTVTRTQFEKIYRHLYQDAAVHAQQLGVPLADSAWALLLRGTGAASRDGSIDLRLLRECIGWTDLLPDDEGVPDTGINVLTIHQSKGMEYGCVALLDPASDVEAANDAACAEEASVLFVGVSRARQRLRRIEGGTGLPTLYRRKFARGARNRWYVWKNGWVNLEIGLPGDLVAPSFVNSRLHGSASEVGDLQDYLARNAAALQGHKVVLCKTKIQDQENRYTYRVHLQVDGQPGRLLATTAPQLVYDLLDILRPASRKWSYSLPGRIFNLRISDVVTFSLAGEGAEDISEPWAQSGLWVGVNLHGTGDFKAGK